MLQQATEGSSLWFQFLVLDTFCVTVSGLSTNSTSSPLGRHSGPQFPHLHDGEDNTSSVRGAEHQGSGIE